MSRPVAQPLRPLTQIERQELQRVSRAPSETVIRHQRAIALLAVADGMSLIEAARAAGWCVHDTVTRLIRRFNERGLAALDDLPRSGHPRSYGPTERARIKMARPPGRSRPCNRLCVTPRMGCHRSAPSPSCIASMKQVIPGSRTGPGVRPAPRSTRERTAWKSVTIPTRRKKNGD